MIHYIILDKKLNYVCFDYATSMDFPINNYLIF